MLTVLVFVFSSPGCVPVTEPVGDIAKAEPDKALIGTWDRVNPGGSDFVIDVPDVKGNPKGLMRAVDPDAAEKNTDAIWFYTTTIGKHSYASMLLLKDGQQKLHLHIAGAYQEWLKEKSKCYFIFRYKIDGDKLMVDTGDTPAFSDLMTAEKFDKMDMYYSTPAVWLDKYLDKSGPDKVFNESDVERFTRRKKK